ncbi:hypothetical protein BDV95DRAFT_645532 [Massariosphaeria phaeospora]|uniref:Uncharacterized protein n=1 Tax=Massariosphaeria phaeospora TaxID=100035 RepID=A0A7C8I1A1_9PLEO|nr:hypothetical protein BDV95DRAFT_645532 [Massariosphaeria phaeospora]
MTTTLSPNVLVASAGSLISNYPDAGIPANIKTLCIFIDPFEFPFTWLEALLRRKAGGNFMALHRVHVMIRSNIRQFLHDLHDADADVDHPLRGVKRVLSRLDIGWTELEYYFVRRWVNNIEEDDTKNYREIDLLEVFERLEIDREVPSDLIGESWVDDALSSGTQPGGGNSAVLFPGSGDMLDDELL